MPVDTTRHLIHPFATPVTVRRNRDRASSLWHDMVWKVWSLTLVWSLTHALGHMTSLGDIPCDIMVYIALLLWGEDLISAAVANRTICTVLSGHIGICLDNLRMRERMCCHFSPRNRCMFEKMGLVEWTRQMAQQTSMQLACQNWLLAPEEWRQTQKHFVITHFTGVKRRTLVLTHYDIMENFVRSCSPYRQ